MDKKLSKYIDHTLLKATATKDEIKKLCDEAKEYDFATVCVNPYWVSYAKEQLKGSTVGVTTVIGFPLGATSTASKEFEAKQAIKDGADELDMVENIGELLAGNYNAVLADIKGVREATKGHTLKVILENCYLNKDQIAKASELCVEAGADFVKTSTGFGTGGATVEDVKIMKKAVGDKAQIKAAGGVHTKAEAMEMIDAGANRIGASAGIKIVSEN